MCSSSSTRFVRAQTREPSLSSVSSSSSTRFSSSSLICLSICSSLLGFSVSFVVCMFIHLVCFCRFVWVSGKIGFFSFTGKYFLTNFLIGI